MKKLFHGLVMCQSMFCAIPCPWHSWDEDARDLMLLWLPIIGLEIGALWFLLGLLNTMLPIPAILKAVILAFYPFLATGYIHLDGYMDVTDAVKSYRSLERRREILKDSHVGSFSVIGCILLMAVQFAACASFTELTDLRILIFIPAVSRCASILAVFILPKMSTSQYIKSAVSKTTAIPAVLLCIFISVGFLWCGKVGFVLVAECIGFIIPLRRAFKSLEGMNGDVSGYAITISEAAALIAAAIL